MLLFVVAYLGGVLTILSPCILPVLPFVFARADRPFSKTGLPLLIGMAITFTFVATLAAVGGGWAVQANDYGRKGALVLLTLFGLTLLIPALGDRLARPWVAIGARLAESTGEGRPRAGLFSPLLLGAATGLLWAPCAGPILGIVLTDAALQGPNARTLSLLLTYAFGAATSLALALLVGGRLFNAMKRSLGAGNWIRRVLGLGLLCGVAAIALGFDTGALARLSSANTNNVEQSLLDVVRPSRDVQPTAAADGNASLPIEGRLPVLAGATAWINSPPLMANELRGKVVLVNFWTYSCINCLRSIPYVRAWAARYGAHGLVVIGVHAPEFAFEKSIENVRRASKDLKLDYPIAIDSDYAIWKAFDNHYWPAFYVVDAQGRIRHHQFGEGDYAQTEAAIQRLLVENGAGALSGSPLSIEKPGAQASPDPADLRSSETYVGYEQAENFASTGGLVRDAAHRYVAGPSLALNHWSLNGDWTVNADRASLDKPNGRIAYRFHARDLHLVLGPGANGAPVRFRVSIDGGPPSDSRGTDVDASGYGTIEAQRLYQLIRQPLPVTDRLFEIEFLDSGAQAFVFTFG